MIINKRKNNNEKEVIKIEENLQSDVQTIEENEDYLRKQKEKMSKKRKEKKDKKEKKEKEEKEEKEQIKENQKEENDLMNLKPKKTVIKNNKQYQ